MSRPKPEISIRALAALPAAARRARVQEYLRAEFAAIANLTLSRDEMERPLQNLGLDSLMAIQFRNRLEASFGGAPSVVDFLKGLSLNQLVEFLLTRVGAAPVDAAANRQLPARGGVPPIAAANIDNLSERELDRLLHALID